MDGYPAHAVSYARRRQHDMMQGTRIYKKVAPNNKLVLYLEKREIVINGSEPPVIRGVVMADADYLTTHRLYGQLVLVFRYGREDEEVMGLTFSNIIILQTMQLHPMNNSGAEAMPVSALQESIERHMSDCGVAHSFHFQVSSCAPPSVSLYPAKSYTGAPLGTSYEIHFFAGENQSEKPLRRASVRMTVRLMQIPPPASGLQPRKSVFKQFLLSGGKVHLEVSLQREVFMQTDSICFRVVINNGCKRTVRKIKAEVVQTVNVAMFKSGKFKSVVASVETQDGCPILTDATYIKDLTLQPQVGVFKNWIALEDSPDRGGRLSPSVVESAVDWNSFAVHVSYYVKVKLLLSGVGGGVSVHVPFISIKEAHMQSAAAAAAGDGAEARLSDQHLAADVHELLEGGDCPPQPGHAEHSRDAPLNGIGDEASTSSAHVLLDGIGDEASTSSGHVLLDGIGYEAGTSSAHVLLDDSGDEASTSSSHVLLNDSDLVVGTTNATARCSDV